MMMTKTVSRKQKDAPMQNHDLLGSLYSPIVILNWSIASLYLSPNCPSGIILNRLFWIKHVVISYKFYYKTLFFFYFNCKLYTKEHRLSNAGAQRCWSQLWNGSSRWPTPLQPIILTMSSFHFLITKCAFTLSIKIINYMKKPCPTVGRTRYALKC